MLETLRTGPGFRIAMTLALFAALCLVAPPAVVAFGHGENTVHCVSHADVKDHGMGHRQLGDGQQKHADHGQLPAKARGCCGLFCLSALAPAVLAVVAGPSMRQGIPPARETRLQGRIPELADPPPIPLLFV